MGDTPKDQVLLEPIGHYHSTKKYTYDTARQSGIDSEHEGVIELLPQKNFEQGLKDLNGFTKIWLIYQFHQNENWKPLVTPPRAPLDETGKPLKVGVFASRSPHRPNSIGISAVTLKKIEGRKLTVLAADLIDSTPILDIKPYIPYADSFPDESIGWLGHVGNLYKIHFQSLAETQIHFLEDLGVKNLKDFLIHQLEYQPTEGSKKRVRQILDNQFCIAYRTWRIDFNLSEASHEINVLRVRSGYSAEELLDLGDPYLDKSIHKAFDEFAQSLACRNNG